MNGRISLNRLQEITLIGILSAIIIATREVLQFLPNIKPVTAIIVISVIAFGTLFGVKLAFVSTLVSSLLLGMGVFVVFQVLAWCAVAYLTGAVTGACRKLSLVPMALFTAAMGYVFGVVVSLEKLLYMGPGAYFAYYVGGLWFDTLHAAGNFVFYLVLAPPLLNLFKKYSVKK